jgi:hypothetical protein
MTHISKHFSYKELTRSQTAIRHGIENKPNQQQTINAKELAKNILEPVREFLKRPVFIGSWFRCFTLNKMIGGSETSQHCAGEAVDIDCDSLNVKIFHFIKDNLLFDQLIWEFGDDDNPAWVHVSFTTERKNRKQVLIAYKENKKTKYKYYV